jgi:hypothetical protein
MRINFSAACVLVCGILVSSAQAGTFSFNAWDGTDANSGIGGYGQGVAGGPGLAVNWNGPTTTVNGVTFVSSPTEPAGAFTPPIAGTVGTFGYSLAGVDTSYTSNPNNHLSGNSANLATNFFYYNEGNAVETLTLTGLKQNTTYEFVEYISQWNLNDSRTQTVTDSSGGSLAFDEDANLASELKDVYNTGTNTSVTFTLTASTNASFHEYAFSNFAEVPEPSSIVALCGLGAMGLFLFVRRRARA